jgi:hypothetical protein
VRYPAQLLQEVVAVLATAQAALPVVLGTNDRPEAAPVGHWSHTTRDALCVANFISFICAHLRILTLAAHSMPKDP